MVGFTDKFKSLFSQAQQKVTDIQDSEKFKDLVGQVQEGVSLAQTKIEEIKANAERERLEAKKSAEKSKLNTAAAHASNHKYQEAVTLLKEIPDLSEFHGEAQDKILEYINTSHEYTIHQSILMMEQDFYDEAAFILESIPSSSLLYSTAQQKVAECINISHERILQQSVLMISDNLYDNAFTILEKIPSSSKFYDEAQQKIVECTDAFHENVIRHSILMAADKLYGDAIAILKKIPSSSKFYDEAQQKIIKYISCIDEYAIQQSALMIEQGLYNDAILYLEAIPNETKSSSIQEKISEYVFELESLIKKHKNLVPVRHNKRIVASVSVDETVYLINRFERTSTVASSYRNIDANGEFFIIQFVVHNHSKKPKVISLSKINILDSQGREYSVSSEGNSTLRSRDETVELFNSNIQPDLEKIVTIVFDVPVGVANSSLKIPCSSWGGSVMLPLSLAI